MFSIDERIAAAKMSAAAGHGILEVMEEILRDLGSSIARSGSSIS